jgi:hypothetical protein
MGKHGVQPLMGLFVHISHSGACITQLLHFGNDDIIKGSLLFCNIFFFNDVVCDDYSHIVGVVHA